MNVFPIRSEEDLDRALERIEALWGAAPGTPEGDELDIMLVLVQAYEAEHHPVPVLREQPDSPAEARAAQQEERAQRAEERVRELEQELARLRRRADGGRS